MNKIKIIVGIVILVVVMLFVVLFFNGKSSKELNVYNTNDFSFKSSEVLEQKYKEDFDIYFQGLNNNVIVLGFKDTPMEKVSLEEYSESVYESKEESALSDLSLNENGFYYFTYKYEEGEVYYLRAIYDNNDDFWIINFACELSDQNKYADDFLLWATTVEFEE